MYGIYINVNHLRNLHLIQVESFLNAAAYSLHSHQVRYSKLHIALLTTRDYVDTCWVPPAASTERMYV